jgi:hypothetical protein
MHATALADEHVGITRCNQPKAVEHQIVIEAEGAVECVNLPSAGIVDFCQRFHVPSVGQLSFDFVTLLRPGADSSATSASVAVSLVNVDARASTTVLERSVEGRLLGGQRIASRQREHVLVSLHAPGAYELRLTTLVDPNSPGAESHLLVDDVLVKDSSGGTVMRLASFCMVGRIRQ